ncbi:anaerobic sulfatase maturase [Clostridium sp. C8-1-8]|uniref:anaerobic sulfatase maturase n=1 Tax=Clostridium sp. C8-1-8 TaxID=2698831 RepID=UPI00137094E4|nr:anaerobic sulfatase maturase [Clostridium sp. C8-1-8]
MKRNLSIMLKPSSSKCNLNCKYCFYNSISKAREVKDYGFMKEEALKEVVEKAKNYCNGGQCTIGFQGGEPLLRGVDFYEKLIKYVDENNNGTTFSYSIQTNGTLITEEWASFFKEHNILVGISIDGSKDIHNMNRSDYLGKDSFNDVVRGMKLLQKYDVDFNVLTVVTPVLAKKIESCYNFYKKSGLRYLQFIPCLESLENEEQGITNKYSLTSKEYSKFLIKLFDLWYEDVNNNDFVSIRYFDNILGLFLGHNYEACDMNGRCSCQHIIESDGSMYPCDFYAYEKHSIGNILNETFDEIHDKDKTRGFILDSININDKCKKCKFYTVCRGGCKRYREGQKENLNYLCSAYYEFFEHSLDKFKRIASMIRINNSR